MPRSNWRYCQADNINRHTSLNQFLLPAVRAYIDTPSQGLDAASERGYLGDSSAPPKAIYQPNLLPSTNMVFFKKKKKMK